MKKRAGIVVLTALTLFVISTFFTIRTQAAAKTGNVLAGTGDQNLKKVCKMITAYTTAMDISDRATTEKVTVKLDDADKLSIAAFVRFNYKNDYGYTKQELGSETKALFGKAARTGMIRAEGKNNLLVCSGDKTYVNTPYMYCGGEFGDSKPMEKIEKVQKTGKNAYEITVQNRLGVYGEKSYDVIGTTVLQVKKSPSSQYGYIIKGITYTYNGIYH